MSLIEQYTNKRELADKNIVKIDFDAENKNKEYKLKAS